MLGTWFLIFLPLKRRKSREQCWRKKWFCVLLWFVLASLVVFVLFLVNYLSNLELCVVLNQPHLLPLMSCLCHIAMSSSLSCPLLIGWMTSSSLISLINFLIVCLMTTDLLYGSLNFRFRLSFEGSYLGSYYLGFLNLSQYIIILLWSSLIIL